MDYIMDKKIQDLQKAYQEVENTLQTGIGNPVSVQSKIQKSFLKLEKEKRNFLKFVLSEKDKLGSKTGADTLVLDLYTKYPSYLDEAFLIKLEKTKIIDSYSDEFDTTKLANQLFDSSNKK